LGFQAFFADQYKIFFFIGETIEAAGSLDNKEPMKGTGALPKLLRFTSVNLLFFFPWWSLRG
jgi:hypothetical protein